MQHKLGGIYWNDEKRKSNDAKEKLVLVFLKLVMLALKSLCYLDRNGSIQMKWFIKCHYLQHTGNYIICIYLNLLIKYLRCQFKNM